MYGVVESISTVRHTLVYCQFMKRCFKYICMDFMGFVITLYGNLMDEGGEMYE